MSILKELEDKLPPNAKISEVKFEGSEIVMYTKSKNFFRNSESSVKNVVMELKKRVEIRPDLSITMGLEEAKALIETIVPKSAGIKAIYFEPELGKVVIEAQKPGLVIGKDGETFKRIKNETDWLPKIERAPAIESDIVRAIRNFLHSEIDYRKKFLNKIGQHINSPLKPIDKKKEWVRMSALGGFRQVGKSSVLIQTPHSNILMDCGVDAGTDEVPFLDAPEFDLESLDAIVLSHSHVDHCLTPDTLVQLSDGDIRQISEVENGQPVEALDFKRTMGIEGVPAIQRGSIKSPIPIYEIRTKTKRIKATGNHPLFVLEKDGSFLIKHVEQLKSGDFVATPRVIEIEGKKQKIPELNGITELDEDTAQVLGYITGDGCKREPGAVLITDKDLDNLRFYSDAITRMGTKNSISVKERNRINIYSVAFKRWLERIEPTIISRSPFRRVPGAVCRSRNSVVSRFLRGLFDAEGCIKHHSVVMSTSSEQLAKATQMLLLRFGVISHLYDHDESKSTFGGGQAFQVCISNPLSLRAFGREIGFSCQKKCERFNSMVKTVGKGMAEKSDNIPIGKELILELARSIGLRKTDLRRMNINYLHYSDHSPSRRKVIEICEKLGRQARLKGIKNEKLSSLCRLVKSPILWDPVVSVKVIETKQKDVFDLTVPGHSNYIADGIFVHNCGFIPFLYKMGYQGPLYCTAPTRDLMVLLCMDYIDVCQKEGKNIFYSKKDIEKAVKHSIVLNYGEVSDIARNVRLTLQPAGHLLGSSLIHLHVGEGLHNILYTGDMKFGMSRLFEPAYTDFQRVETLIMESTYGAAEDVFKQRSEMEKDFMDIISRTIERGGKVLIPSFAVGRAQEVMAILVANGFSHPVYMEGMLWDATAIHTAYPEYLSKYLQRSIFRYGKNPFLAEIFHHTVPKERDAIIDSREPCVVIATSGMLIGGPAIEYLKGFAPDKRNTLLFVGYQGEGSLGRRIQKGWREIPIQSEGRTRTMAIEMEVQTVHGLSGHSGRNELMAYMHRLACRPERVVLNHGESKKCAELARDIHKIFKCETMAPKNLDAVRLR